MKFRNYFNLVANFYEKLLTFLPIKKEEMRIILSVKFSKNDKVLDVGCGVGIYLKAIENKVKISIGLDNSKKMIKQARKLCKKSCFVLSDAENFSFKLKFSRILCLGVLEFCRNPEKVLQNCFEHSSKGGKIILLYPKENLLGYFYKFFHLLVSGNKINLFEETWPDDIAKNFNLRKISRVNFFFSVISIYEKR